MDEEIGAQISKLPNDWKVTDPHGKVKTKNNLEYCIWGVENEGDNVVYFVKAILEKYPPPHKTISQFDSMLVSRIKIYSHIWRHHVLNFIFLEKLTKPLQHLPSIFVIYLPNHYVTLVVDGGK